MLKVELKDYMKDSKAPEFDEQIMSSFIQALVNTKFNLIKCIKNNLSMFFINAVFSQVI